MKKIIIVSLVIILIATGYFYFNKKSHKKLISNSCVTLIVPKFDENQMTIDEYTKESVNLCVGEDYLIDYSNVFALKNAVKRFKIQYTPNTDTSITVTSEEEYLEGKPSGNFIKSQAKVFLEGDTQCFNVTGLVMDVSMFYCFYNDSPDTLELKIKGESTLPPIPLW